MDRNEYRNAQRIARLKDRWKWYLSTLAVVTACLTDRASGPTPTSIQARRFDNSEWSAPVNVGAPVSSAAAEQNPALSPDELSLYFLSNRAGGLGGNDLWVSHRDCKSCPWGEPANLGAPVNTPEAQGSPYISIDGHLLFFNDARPGGHGGTDMWMSRRADPKDDFGWGPPVNLGPEVNTPAFEGGATYLQSAEAGGANLYFGRGPSGVTQDIYHVAVGRDGEVRGPAELVLELSDLTSTVNDARPALRDDGREVVFFSNRPGGFGSESDLWTSTRRSSHDPWSTPENLGPVMNTSSIETQPWLSPDGRTLLFSSNRPGALGANDIWISTRTPSGHE